MSPKNKGKETKKTRGAKKVRKAGKKQRRGKMSKSGKPKGLRSDIIPPDNSPS